MADYRHLGTDIRLARYVGTPSAAPLAAADSWGTLDAALVPGMARGLPTVADPMDIAAIAGRRNLGQALMLRLLTPLGALGPLGHPDYGCRLTELIGGRNDAVTRARARLFVLQALAAEARVAEITALSVEPVPGMPERMAISFAVRPVAAAPDEPPLALGLEVAL